MESLQNTKQRIKLVSSIKKITHAMEMISIAKIRRTKNIFNNISPYSEEMNLTFGKSSQEILEIIEGIKLIKSYVNEEVRQKKYF